jgi:hypothetical protein
MWLQDHEYSSPRILELTSIPLRDQASFDLNKDTLMTIVHTRLENWTREFVVLIAYPVCL